MIAGPRLGRRWRPSAGAQTGPSLARRAAAAAFAQRRSGTAMLVFLVERDAVPFGELGGEAPGEDVAAVRGARLQRRISLVVPMRRIIREAVADDALDGLVVAVLADVAEEPDPIAEHRSAR